jgi:hypothetical protein
MARTMAVLSLVLSTVVCFAVQKSAAVPNFAGTWKLDLIHSTAGPEYLQASSIVVTPYDTGSDRKLQFEFMGGEKLLSRAVYTLDGREYPTYSNRKVAKAYVSARINKSALVVRTRTVLDLDDTQEYTETSTWSVSSDGKVLTDKTTDGKLVCYVKQADPDQPEQSSSQLPK